MKLYNTLSKQIEEFVPLNDNQVKFFVCGPTVYDFTHIGNAKTYIQFDVLARTLRVLGYDVTYLQNITDIDDKIIARAAEQSISWEALRDQYETEYKQDMASLGNTAVTTYARATDYIPDIIRQVQTLLDKGHAYQIEDGIYFEIKTFPDYGKLSGRTEVKEDDAETRIDHSDEKRGWNDFCLWKFSKPGEPVWAAPFGDGRPGWHIEDTAITEHFFGPQYDVHGGAVDLIFPHHEAEITQMESASSKVPFVKYWTHTGFLNIDNRRMGKSMGNFFTIREVLEKGYDPMALRLFMLQGHYRSPINFSWENLDAAQSRLSDLRAWADLRHQPSADSMPKELDELFRDTKDAITKAMSEDLNTPEALAALGKLVNYMQNIPIPGAEGQYTNGMLGWLDELFGLGLSTRPDITDEQKELLAGRQKARDDKNWQRSDEVRDQLTVQGIGVRDTAYGQQWFRTSI